MGLGDRQKALLEADVEYIRRRSSLFQDLFSTAQHNSSLLKTSLQHPASSTSISITATFTSHTNQLFTMKNIHLGLLALLLNTAVIEGKNYKKNVPTYEIGKGMKIIGNKIEYEDPDCDPVFDCQTSKVCSATGYTPSVTADKKFFACCAQGQRLLGSPETAFDCCAEGHDLVGSAGTGYHCCPNGYTYDGQMCRQVCDNGKTLVDGKCACPEGTAEGQDGQCIAQPKPKPGKCTSGIEYGKCYIFTGENGNKLGLRGDGVYYSAPDAMNQRYGKFQLCADEKCTTVGPVDPSSEIYIRDTYGDLATGANKGRFLNNAANGVHIGRAPTFATAGKFSLTKWPCGKYCLGGADRGIGPACPADIPAMTFYPQDPQMCVAFELTEVPCDIKADTNNCIWNNGEQCCNKVDCSGAAEKRACH
ncbi:cystein rich protein [Xylaria sp. CBS 124048]|nr:cystein rich protein [Xylaria sp. CBS 124048]